MSPSTLRRYRAERLLRQEFGGLREEVLRSVRGRLRSRGVHLDGGDLEACYAVAWQGLYAAIYAGEEIANPAGWLVLVTFRRAIDEHRSARARGFGEPARLEPAEVGRVAIESRVGSVRTGPSEPDLASVLDDRARLRQLFEALRSQLSRREREAACLCYLQGLTRAEAARRMGIGEARMTKLMEGRGPGRPGVAGKVGELLETVGGGHWCEQQGSLMRGFAFGILDPRGERYRLARLHQRECPACRAYVLSLRGLAAVLPPLPLPWGLGLGRVPHAPLPRVGHSTGGGAVAATGAAGAVGAGGVASGGWWLGGSVGAKLAVGCLLALSVGCVAITAASHHGDGADRGHPSRKAPAAATYLADAPNAPGSASLAASTPPGGPAFAAAVNRSQASARHISAKARAAAVRRAAGRHAQREFGLERPDVATAAATVAAGTAAQSPTATARAASVARTTAADAGGAAESSAGQVAQATAPTSTPSTPASHAEREFGLK